MAILCAQFFPYFWNTVLLRAQFFITLFMQIKLQAAASYKLQATSNRSATSYRLQASCLGFSPRMIGFFRSMENMVWDRPKCGQEDFSPNTF